MKKKKRYEALLDEHGAKELSESFVFPVVIDDQENGATNEALRDELGQRRAAMGAGEELKFTLLQLRFQIEDYIKEEGFDEHKTFGYFLKAYIDCLNKKRKDFAHEINITASELSQYVNDTRTPPLHIMVRLELHSRETIPAEDWYQLVEKENLHELKANRTLRTEQKKFVLKEAELV